MTSEHEIQAQGEYIQRMLEAARKFSTKQRKQMAGKTAMPDGSFPIANKSDLKNAIQAFGRAKNKAAAKAHIIRRARALGATDLLPDDWKKSSKDKASMDLYTCPEDGCDRAFLHEEALVDHADSVHTYSEIETRVAAALRSKFGRAGSPVSAAIYVWINDLADDWVAFTLDENGGTNGLFKCSYEIDEDSKVTLGDPVAVERRVVYVPAPAAD